MTADNKITAFNRPQGGRVLCGCGLSAEYGGKTVMQAFPKPMWTLKLNGVVIAYIGLTAKGKACSWGASADGYVRGQFSGLHVSYEARCVGGEEWVLNGVATRTVDATTDGRTSAFVCNIRDDDVLDYEDYVYSSFGGGDCAVVRTEGEKPLLVRADVNVSGVGNGTLFGGRQYSVNGGIFVAKKLFYLRGKDGGFEIVKEEGDMTKADRYRWWNAIRSHYADVEGQYKLDGANFMFEEV